MNKIKIIILALALTVSISACKKNENKDANVSKETQKVEVSNEVDKTPVTTEGVDNKETTENPSTETTDSENKEKETEKKENENKEDKTKEGETENPEDKDKKEAAPTTLKEELEILEKNSDYISIIRMSQTGTSGKEIHVLDDIKGSIKNIILPNISNIEPNQDYLIFLVDSENGDITLTDIDRGLIKISGNNDEHVKILEEILNKDKETDKK